MFSIQNTSHMFCVRFKNYHIDLYIFLNLILLIFFLLASIIVSYPPRLCAEYVYVYLEIKVDLNFLKFLLVFLLVFSTSY